jgi:hypothetical protein
MKNQVARNSKNMQADLIIALYPINLFGCSFQQAINLIIVSIRNQMILKPPKVDTILAAHWNICSTVTKIEAYSMYMLLLDRINLELNGLLLPLPSSIPNDVS